jgi:hypothetical protein
MSSSLMMIVLPNTPITSPWEFELAHERSIPEREPAAPMMATRTRSGKSFTTSQETKLSVSRTEKLAAPKGLAITPQRKRNTPKKASNNRGVSKSKTARNSKSKPTIVAKVEVHQIVHPKDENIHAITKALERFESFYGMPAGRDNLSMHQRFDELEEVMMIVKREEVE